MSPTPVTSPASSTQTQVVVTSPTASPSHPNHAQLILGAILAALQAALPIFINLLPPPAQLGVELGEVGLGTTISVLSQTQGK